MKKLLSNYLWTLLTIVTLFASVGSVVALVLYISQNLGFSQDETTQNIISFVILLALLPILGFAAAKILTWFLNKIK